MTILAVAKTGNAKTGPVAVTYAPIAPTCPRTCAHHPESGDGTCYAASGVYTRPIDRRLTVASGTATPIKLAREEARAIDGLYPRGLPPGHGLRIHVAGDASTPGAARALAGAAVRWIARGGARPWAYTHAWRSVHRSDWGAVSVLASVDAPAEYAPAIRRGYALATVVASFPRIDGRAKRFDLGGHAWIPCPAQLRAATRCVDCRLCWNADDLRDRGMGIAFEAHGPGAAKIKRRLTVTP